MTETIKPCLGRKIGRCCCFRSDTEALPSLLSNIPDDLIWQYGCHGNRPELSDYCRSCQTDSQTVERCNYRLVFIACILHFLSNVLACFRQFHKKQSLPGSPHSRKPHTRRVAWTSLTQLWRSNILLNSVVLCLWSSHFEIENKQGN